MTTIESATASHIAESQHGYISDKKRYLERLKRIEGQTRGIHRMVEEELNHAQYALPNPTSTGSGGPKSTHDGPRRPGWAQILSMKSRHAEQE